MVQHWTMYLFLTPPCLKFIFQQFQVVQYLFGISLLIFSSQPSHPSTGGNDHYDACYLDQSEDAINKFKTMRSEDMKVKVRFFLHICL